MSFKLNQSELIEYLLKENNNQSVEQLVQVTCSKFDVDENTVEWAIEMIEAAYLRVGFIRAGKQYPKSNLDKDSFLIEAMKLLTEG